MLTSHMELRSYHMESCSHSHDFAQLLLPIMGSMELELGSYFNVVHEDIGVYIAPNEHHCFSGSQENLFLVIDLAAEDNFFGTTDNFPILNLTTGTKKFIQFVHYYLTHHERTSYTDSLINQLLLNLSSPSDLTSLPHKVLKAKNWIDMHFVLPVNIEQVAKHCYISTSQLQRLFKQYTSLGIAEYWRRRKLQRAKVLLSASDRSIEAIAFEIGYEQVSAFSRRFSQVMGESPLQWRMKALNAKKMRGMDN